MGNSRLLGYKRFLSKKGVRYCVANIVTEYNERELATGDYVGSKVEEIFLPNEQIDYLSPGDLGKEVSMFHEIVGNRAYLVKFEVVGKK